jgi:hypothetical protein
MKTVHRHLMLATALATVLGAAPLQAQDVKTTQETVKTTPGFNPGSGQINPGETKAAPSASTDIRKIPTHDEALAAFRKFDDPNPALGAEAPQQSTTSNNKTVSPAGGSGDPTTATQGQAAIGGPMSPGASAGGGNAQPGGPANAASDKPAGETVGARPAASAAPSKDGPIGATGQTMPSKLSERNEVLDRLPIMAWPLQLTDEERQQIYKAVMADKAQPVADADALTTASELSPSQALTGMHPLPATVSGLGALNKLAFVKGKNKVLLVIPSTRTVVDEISS